MRAFFIGIIRSIRGGGVVIKQVTKFHIHVALDLVIAYF